MGYLDMMTGGEMKYYFWFQWVFAASILIVMWNVYIGLVTMGFEFIGFQAWMYKRQLTLLEKHMGELYFDTYTMKDKTLAQDQIYCFKDAQELELFSDVSKILPGQPEYKDALAFVLQKHNDQRKIESVLRALQEAFGESTPAAATPSAPLPAATVSPALPPSGGSP